jgi:phage/plasmid-like protein (TIGR03299 family)
MPADVESFVTVREPAWHNLGVVIEDHVNTAEMLRIGNLAGWNVRVEEVELPAGYYAETPQFRTVRNSPFVPGNTDVLGYVGSRYVPIQNEEAFSFGDALLDGGQWETAGSLRGGTRVFGSLRLEHEVAVGGVDQIDSYLLVSTSHDGTLPIQASVTPVRVVCSNTLNLALSGAKQTFKIRHTTNVAGKVQAAREALGLADQYLHVWTDEMNVLADTSFTNIQFEELIQSLYAPKSDSKAGATRAQKRHEIIWDLWTGDTVGDAFGTAYGALNALNEELMWFRNGRGDNSLVNVAASRSGFNPIWNAENNGLLKAVKTAAGV